MIIQGISKVVIISQNIIILNEGIFIERLNPSLFYANLPIILQNKNKK